MILRLDSPAAAGDWCAEQREEGASIGFVPTMGALHDGHLELVRRAVAENDRACVSVFVNPLQIDDPGDLAGYPRDWEGDGELLQGVGCHMVFTGTLEGFFPGRLDATGALPAEEHADPGPAATGLEGQYRQGHFGGVATIVRRLFEVVRPTRAYFGEKDFQQCLVVEHVARQLTGGPEVITCPTAREESGLARSSRNERLTAEERRKAVVLHRALGAARRAWSEGARDAALLSRVMHEVLSGEPELTVEYAEVRDPACWSAGPPDGELQKAQALVAARLGAVRLIDNLRLDGPSSGPSPEAAPEEAPRAAGESALEREGGGAG